MLRRKSHGTDQMSWKKTRFSSLLPALPPGSRHTFLQLAKPERHEKKRLWKLCPLSTLHRASVLVRSGPGSIYVDTRTIETQLPFLWPGVVSGRTRATHTYRYHTNFKGQLMNSNSNDSGSKTGYKSACLSTSIFFSYTSWIERVLLLGLLQF